MLGRRVYTRVQFVFQQDPAIAPPKTVKDEETGEEKEVDSYLEYMDGGYDYSKLDIVGTPTVWTLKPLTYPQRMHRNSITDLDAKVRYIFRCGLVSLDNYPLFVADDKVEILGKVKTETVGDDTLVSEEWLETAQIPDDQMGLVVGVIQAITEAEEGKP